MGMPCFARSNAALFARLLPATGLLGLFLMTQTAAAELIPRINIYEGLAGDAEVLRFSADRRHLWIYGEQRLQAFHSDGRTILDRKLPQLPDTRDAVDMAIGEDTVWLAIGRALYQFDIKGKLVSERRFRHGIRAVHYDARQSRILVTTPHDVIVLDEQGRQVDRIRTRLPNIA